ncbi:MAG: LptF/LptG family permease [Candidatus Kapabacteria bacterium]|jgi:lipopolysaccharide export system permease protein|nr:LptF/LptG family permease [Candidatus Kapabacteria bacterium]
MSHISLYILRAHIGPFFFGAITVMFVFLLNFLILFLPQIVGKGLGTWLVIQLIALNLAWMVTLAVPLGVLVASLMAFGNLGSTNEITVMKSGGTGLLRMMRPMIITGILLSAWLFWFNDYVLPDANYRAQMLMIDIQRKKPTFVVDKGQFSMQIEGYSILARNIDTAQGLMLGVTIYDNTSLDVMSVVSADTGRINFSTDYSKAVLMLHNGELHQASQQNYGDYRRLKFEQHRIIMDANGFAFSRSDESLTSRGDRTMRIADMRVVVTECEKNITQSEQSIAKTLDRQIKHISGIKDSTVPEMCTSPIQGDSTTKTVTRKDAAWRTESRLAGTLSMLDNDIFQIRDRQMNANKYLVEIHKKYAIPAVCLVFVLIGCPLGIATKRGNFGISGAITLVFYIIYWIFLMTGERFADRGLIVPWLSMWLGDIVLAVFGMYLIWRVGRDMPIVDLTRLYALWGRVSHFFARVKFPRLKRNQKPIDTQNESISF